MKIAELDVDLDESEFSDLEPPVNRNGKPKAKGRPKKPSPGQTSRDCVGVGFPRKVAAKEPAVNHPRPDWMRDRSLLPKRPPGS